ncbi:unnamed protein product [Blepharisma stoltei]|uniref:Uncharacterized protein n=1 Tax=Blepharisma stoltei TaxID=1481888 RepID=A0AAU9K1S2_9CILI|nr:unnamed protein product [Blepharisma stoltei]
MEEEWDETEWIGYESEDVYENESGCGRVTIIEDDLDELLKAMACIQGELLGGEELIQVLEKHTRLEKYKRETRISGWEQGSRGEQKIWMSLKAIKISGLEKSKEDEEESKLECVSEKDEKIVNKERKDATKCAFLRPTKVLNDRGETEKRQKREGEIEGDSERDAEGWTDGGTVEEAKGEIDRIGEREIEGWKRRKKTIRVCCGLCPLNN